MKLISSLEFVDLMKSLGVDGVTSPATPLGPSRTGLQAAKRLLKSRTFLSSRCATVTINAKQLRFHSSRAVTTGALNMFWVGAFSS
jgi:hypothetical protein